MLPPGKNNGCTTNESVENASRALAEREHGRVRQAPEHRIRERGHEEMLDQLARHLSAAAVAHHDRRVVA